MISEENKILNRERLLKKYRDKYVGAKFGLLTITDFIKYLDKGSVLICRAKCECSVEKEYIFLSLRDGNTKSCGCLKRTDIDVLIKEKSEMFIGKKYGKLTVIEILGYGTGHDILCLARCDCGTTKRYSLYKIEKSTTTSCGCYRKEFVSAASKTHGLTKHPLYRIWSGIKSRCYNSKFERYATYGAKGVEMCKEWINDFPSFYNWCLSNGWQKGLQIDKDKKSIEKLGVIGKMYSPEWCSVITPFENSNFKRNNKALTINGERVTVSQASKKYNINYNTLQRRLERGWSDYDATHNAVQSQFGNGHT